MNIVVIFVDFFALPRLSIQKLQQAAGFTTPLAPRQFLPKDAPGG